MKSLSEKRSRVLKQTGRSLCRYPRCQTNEYRYFSMYFSVKHPADCGASIALRIYGFGPEHKFRKHGKGRKSLTGSEFREKM